MQVRKLIAADAAALERFNSCLLESYVEVRHAQHLSRVHILTGWYQYC